MTTNTPQTDDLTARFDALISDETRVAVNSVVEYEIDREYGGQDPNGAHGARLLAIAGIKMDTRDLYLELNGGDELHLNSYANSQLRVMVEQGLAARRCQCTSHTRVGLAHDHVDYQCANHYEHDVPAVAGKFFCGSCYPTYADAAGV